MQRLTLNFQPSTKGTISLRLLKGPQDMLVDAGALERMNCTDSFLKWMTVLIDPI